MFRVLSSLVQSVGTCLLVVGLCFQIYSLNSNRWITWVTQDANEGLFYFEGNFSKILNLRTLIPRKYRMSMFQANFDAFSDYFIFGELIALFEASNYSETWLFRIMESVYDSTKSSRNAMGMLELERTFNFKGWELSYIFSYSDKVRQYFIMSHKNDAYLMTDIIHRRHCTGIIVKMTISLLGTSSEYINIM